MWERFPRMSETGASTLKFCNTEMKSWTGMLLDENKPSGNLHLSSAATLFCTRCLIKPKPGQGKALPMLDGSCCSYIKFHRAFHHCLQPRLGDTHPPHRFLKPRAKSCFSILSPFSVGKCLACACSVDRPVKQFFCWL